jgi:hypothetical protein
MARKPIAALLLALVTSAASAATTTAIILRDHTALRAAPRDAAQQQAVLWQGEAVEVRGERLDYVQVYDHRRERGGFVRAQNLKRLQGSADEAPELLAVLRYLLDTPGSEALAIGLAAAFIQAAPASMMQGDAGIEVLDVMGNVAERLARRATVGAVVARGNETAMSAHLDVAARYGLKLISVERDGRMQICYDGAVFQRILAMRSSPEQRARAALSLTRSDCVDADLRPAERARLDEWRADMLDKVEVATLPGHVKNRVLMRRATVWSAVAYQRARRGDGAAAIESAANRAISEIAGVNKLELPDEDQSAYNDTAMRVSAVRWAAAPVTTAAEPAPGTEARPTVAIEVRQPGETCVLLIDAKHDVKNPLATRCTYGLVWARSATLNREGTALALAVQQLEAWRELWVFRKEGNAWSISVLPPAPTNPEIGYAEFAGWVPGGKHMLLAREARGEGKYKRSFEMLRLDTLAPERQAGDPSMLVSFQRWQDPVWKKTTLSLR